MTGIKPSSHGIVVDHVESGVRYAISDRNYDVKVHRKVRDLGPGESVLGFQPKRRGDLGETLQDASGPLGSSAPTGASAGDQAVGSGDSPQTPGGSTGHTKTEGSASAVSQDKKEGN